MKKKRLRLHIETLRQLSVEQASGGILSAWTCPVTACGAVSRAFTNCDFCDVYTAVGSTCITCMTCPV
jgi:hypothetical protein